MGVVLVLGVACTPASQDNEPRKPRKPEVDPKTQPLPPAATPAWCDDTHGIQLELELQAICEAGGAVTRVDVPPSPFEVPESSRLAYPPLVVEPGRVSLGLHVAREQLASYLEAIWILRWQNGKSSYAWSAIIASPTPASEVAAVLRQLVKTGQMEGQLVLRSPSRRALRPRLERRLESAEKRTRGDGRHLKILIDELDAALPASCASVRRAFHGFAHYDPVETCPSLPRELSAALVECGCENEDEILTLLYGLVVDTVAHDNAAVLVDVVLDPTATPWSGGTWGDIVSAVDADDLQRFWVVE